MIRMMENEITYGIEHLSFRGVVGHAIHFYGKAWVYDPSGEAWDDRYKEFDIKKTINAKEAKIINERDGALTGFSSYREGDEIIRLDDLEELRDLGISLLIEKFGEDIKIRWGSPYDCEPDIMLIYENGKKHLTNFADLL